MKKVQEELEEARAEIEKLKCEVEYKESIIKELSSGADSERVESKSRDKFRRLEDEKRQLLESIDVAIEERREKEEKLNDLVEEAETLKSAVSVLQEKCAEAEKEAKSPKQRMWEGGGLVLELEDRNRKLEDELKWKGEQFKHLQEAHEKLRDQLNLCRSEWESERDSFVDEISGFQTRVDEEVRKGEGFRSQLVMCKQALENEQRVRKKLEGEVSEMRLLLERVTVEGGDVNVERECSTAEAGVGEVDDLRHSLRVKELEFKDVEYKARKLEEENQEILASLRELQEAQIPRAVPTPSSWAKLRGKLKSLEQTHRECAANMKAKEEEWRSQSRKMSQELERCSSSLQIKDTVIVELTKELDDCNSSLTDLKMQNEELSLMLQLMKSEFSDSEPDQNGRDSREGGLVQLVGQLEKEREEMIAMEKKLEEASERESSLRDELQEVYDVLDNIDSELTDKTYLGSELELELHDLRSVVERLQMQLEESQETRRELEASLLAQAEVEEMFNKETEEKDRRISNLEQQILLMDQEIRIGENDDDVEYDEDCTEDDTSVPRFDAEDDDDELHLHILARELEVAILEHITEERKHNLRQGLQRNEIDYMNTRVDDDEELEGSNDSCSSKENVNQQNYRMGKTVESIFDERSPFRVLN